MDMAKKLLEGKFHEEEEEEDEDAAAKQLMTGNQGFT
jgi:hypothetical protein